MRWPWRRRPPEPAAHGDRSARAWRRLRPLFGAREHELRLVQVAYARNLAEAEMIEDLLRQQGIPSLTQRNRGFDVPDFLAAGARDVLVAEQHAQRARELLGADGAGRAQ